MHINLLPVSGCHLLFLLRAVPPVLLLLNSQPLHQMSGNYDAIFFLPDVYFPKVVCTFPLFPEFYLSLEHILLILQLCDLLLTFAVTVI
jgi:hypothetical protein